MENEFADKPAHKREFSPYNCCIFVLSSYEDIQYPSEINELIEDVKKKMELLKSKGICFIRKAYIFHP